MRQNGLFWGIVLILVGGLFLLNTLGIFSFNVWNLIWPFFLILLGAWILFGVFGVGGNRPLEVENASFPLEGAQAAVVRVQHGAGRLTVNGESAPGVLASGAFGGGLEYRQRKNGNTLELDLRPRWRDNFVFGIPWSWGNSRGYIWNVALSHEVPLSLRLETGAGESQVDLSDLNVTDLHMSTGASSTDLMLPAQARNTRVKLEAGAASINVRVPGGVAAQIRTQAGISSISVDQTRFPRMGNVYQSPDYATASNRIDLDIQMGVGSVTVR
jgi:hypothetical protein